MNIYPNRKSKEKGARHLFEILNQIKDSILKKRYNLAWELASKHYEQNRNSLTNQEIYQLCWQSCIAIEKKIYHRLTAKHKRNIAPVANSHIQHVLSLQLSLHSIVLPEVVSQDRAYFNMLYNQSQSLDPKTLSEQQLIFQRKNQNSFLPHESTHKQMKKIVKQHLKICNCVLMYKVARKKSPQDVRDIVAAIQNIFDGVKEHQFPEQVMDFQLIKLSIIEELGVKEGIQCEYRLPLGFLNKIYQRLRKRKEEYLDHYLKKLTSYLVLCFRHLTVSIEDVYVGCCEAKFIARIAHAICLPSSKTILQTRRKTNKHMHRMPTLENESIEQPHSRFSKIGSQTMGECNSTQKKIDSKKKVTNKGQNKLKQCAQQGLKLLEDHIQGRRELSEIILKYYNQYEIKKKHANSDFKEEFIENAVRLNEELRNRKKVTEANDEDSDFRTHLAKNKDSLLTTMLTRPKMRPKSSVFDVQENEHTLIKMPTANKSKAKFILKNIQMVKKPVQPTQQHFDRINTLVSKIEQQQQLQDLSFDYSDDQEDYQFQRQRKKKIQQYKLKLTSNNQKLKSIARNQSAIPKDLTTTEYTCTGASDQARSTKIAMLDEVVSVAIKQRLLGNQLTNIPPLKKLQALRISVENLNTERKMLVQSLSIRQNESDKFIKENIRSFSHYTEAVKQNQKQQIDLIVDAFKQRVTSHIAHTRKLVNFNKVKDSFLMKKGERQQKLKIETKKVNRRLSELTFQKIEDAYRTIQGALQNGEIDNQMALRYQFDQLRRDVAKNQFITQTEKKNAMKKRQSVLPNIPTIVQLTREEDTMRG